MLGLVTRSVCRLAETIEAQDLVPLEEGAKQESKMQREW
jgi:hypothetical protein